MSLVIRIARVDDGKEMRDCSLRILPNETSSPVQFEHILSTWPGLSHVSVNDKNEIVGICLVKINEELEAATHAHVTSLFVLPKHQGQGVGRRLLTTSLQSAGSQFNVSEVTLNVRKSNKPAIGLYTSLKFYTTEIKSGFYDDGEDAFAMSLLLKDDVNT